ncbi:MAG TPA: voltage-gated chloride channel family protein, partial [Cytophagaceae bacterium]
YILKWILISAIIGVLAGSASAFFLVALDWATNWRESHPWIIGLLPLGGLLIGLMYHYLGKEVEAGNNLVLEQIHKPGKMLHFKMAPLILIGTVATHFFGGSAGREGTAVQMGASIADQLNHWIKVRPRDRIIILLCGISAGFASVFGTPLAGMLFALEVYYIGRLRYNAIFPCLLAAVIGDLVCDGWGVLHTGYYINDIPLLTPLNILYTILAGIAFGLTAVCFIRLTHAISSRLKSKISYAPLRPAVGGVMVVVAVLALGTTKYIGLGIPVIVDSFEEQLPVYDFALKLLFTAITLGAAFKGGEVTPLFFIGATLGNALSLFIPLPMALLAGIGFVAVFSGAANTPLATTIMAIELFGMEAGVYAGIACVTAYMFSGHTGIYSSQVIGEGKHLLFGREQGMKLGALKEWRRSK